MNYSEIINLKFFSSVALNLLILLGLTSFNSFISFKKIKHPVLMKIFNGFIIGFIVFVLMENPWLSIPDKNLFFDVRTIIYVISACCYGFTTTLVAALLGIGYRLQIGFINNNIVTALVGAYSIVISILIIYLIKFINKKLYQRENCKNHFLKGFIVHVFVTIPFFFLDIYKEYIIVIIVAHLLLYPTLIYLLSKMIESQYSKKLLVDDNIYQGSILNAILNSSETVEIYALDKNYNYINFNKFHYDQMKTFYNKEIYIGMNIFAVLEDDVMMQRLKKYYDLSFEGMFNVIESEVEVNKGKYLQEHFSPIFNVDKEIVGITVFSQDITYIVEKEKEINDLIYYDPLTKVYNRRAFKETIDYYLTNDDHNFVIAYFDINGLKTVNDSIGHQGGDELLVTVANVLHEDFKDYQSLVFRMGGDEFIVILKEVTHKQANRLIEKTINKLSKKNIGGFPVSVSYGFSIKTLDKNLQEVLKEAENAMYQNKIYEITSHRSNSISTIIQTLKERDHLTEAHSNNVSKIAEKIGYYLNMSLLDISQLKLISRLHDIGKIGIDDAILNKKGKLTDAEYEEIKRHPAIGYRILSTIPEYLEIAHDVLYHHERYDGKGYPKGLKGENIPIRSRIISVADAYDAMTSDRPYRKKMTKEEAIEEIKKNSGTQFDPIVVEAFLKSI